MRNGLKFIGMAAVAALSLTAMAIQEGIVIKRAPKVGEVSKYRLKAEMDMGGQPITFTGLIMEKVTKVADSGDYTVESNTSEAKVNVGGTEMDASGQGDAKTTTTFKSTGEVVTVLSEMADPNIYRIANLNSLRFPATALKVGDKWDVAIKKDDKGSVEGKGSYKVEAREKIGEYDTYKITGSFKETTGDQPAGMDGTFWINVKDGTLVKMTGTMTNAPYPQVGPLTAKVTMTREG